ncbi:alpha/beta hydrolase [Streptomyces sp. CA-179760]|uniref:alpha/beta hydrolase n=1 Tax=Streptomyces sp. CA-179760 TaxID=3240054 RepID=UPI003D89F846
MSFSLDPEIAEGVETLFKGFGEVEPMAVDDVVSRRAIFDKMQLMMFEQLPTPGDVNIRDYETTTQDGARIVLRWYTKGEATPGSAVLYAHGSGMIASRMEIYDGPVARYVSATGVPFLSVAYRKAPEFPAPIPVTDCYAGLQWLVEHASELRVDPDRIAVMGDSGGGGIVASLAIYARDHEGPAIARQILIYPMLDDRNTTPEPGFSTWIPWSYEDNITGWGALLGSAVGGPDVSPYGAAARLKDFSGLPPAYVEVGELDIFRDESIAYAQKLYAASVSTELHVIPRAPHAFEAFVPTAEISRRAGANRHRILNSI